MVCCSNHSSLKDKWSHNEQSSPMGYQVKSGGITRELDKEPSLHCFSIYTNYMWSILQQYYSCPNVHALSSCPITHPHVFSLRLPCFLHVPCVICKPTCPENYISAVMPPLNPTSPPSMAATFLATRLMAVLQPSGYSVFHGGDTPIQLSLPWRCCFYQCLNTETSARGNRGFTTETPSISYRISLYIRLVVTL